MKRLMFLSLAALGALTGLSGQVFQASEAVCCTGKFTLDCVLASASLPKAEAGRVQLLVFREGQSARREYPGSTDPPLRYYQKLFWDEFAEMPGLAYVVQSGKGASAVLWHPHSGRYETRRLWGHDVLRLDDGSEVVAVGPGRRVRDTVDLNVVRVWVWRKGNLEEQAVLSTITELRRSFGVESIQVVVGSQPHLWEATGFPLVVPGFGALGLDGIRGAEERRFYVCWAEEAGSEPRCYLGGENPKPARE